MRSDDAVETFKRHGYYQVGAGVSGDRPYSDGHGAEGERIRWDSDDIQVKLTYQN